MSGRISPDHSRSASRSSQTPRLSQGGYESMPRQSFGRTSRVSNPNVFSDEYSLEPIDVDQIERAPSPVSIASSTTLTHPSQKHTGIAAAPEHVDPFADDARVSFEEPYRSSLPQKGAFANNRNSVSSINNAPFAVQRNQSVSSRFSIPRALSPYTGATSPSHPYSMYPQVGVSRTPSVGSTSTIRPQERPLGETNGPQHPYGMYTQNVVEEGMDDEIPVGFPGINSSYQPPPGRRIDDVGDIIGPDGHTEPLPPYSRYPTGAVPGAETMADGTGAPVDVNLGQDEHQLNSTSANSSSREPPISSTSSRVLIPEGTGNSGHYVGPAAAGASGAAATTGIMEFEEKLKRKGKQTACCGLPVWTLVLIATVMLIGGSIGGVIGGVLGTKRAHEADRQQAADHSSEGPYITTVTASNEMDYSSMTTTPTGFKAAPTGHYTIDTILQNYSRMCVENHDVRAVWSCLDKPEDFEIIIGESGGQQSIVFTSEAASTTTYSYGAQQPVLPTPTQNLSIVADKSETSFGPALFFWSYFDKLVVLPEDAIEVSSNSKREISTDGMSGFMERKQAAQPGEKPWFCWWNSTKLEFFLYVNQSAHDTNFQTTAVTGGNLAASMATAQAQKRDELTNYPRIIKMEERRDHEAASSPYCQQMQVDSYGHVQSIAHQTYAVQEIAPTPTTTYVNTAAGTESTYTAKVQWATPCYCLSLNG
ncbi:hypothetical protein N7456_009863 [Penicillium angulare]|uniref:DUF7820 domain-containing protein n=1 Tax=Penicillium angulare TaxID=116970 RepID=A0A9W9F5M9_9EURO|nr:hypothetical protein N7456_009863 [Penicillium angulare]